MKLYLARHGEYALDTLTGQDVLTQQGIQDVTKIAQFLKPLNLSISQIFHSTKHRAEQTAAILSQGFNCRTKPQARDGLNPEDNVVSLAETLFYEEQSSLYVGHLPFMGKLVSYLLTQREDKNLVLFQPGTLLCLEQVARFDWTISCVLQPSCLKDQLQSCPS